MAHWLFTWIYSRYYLVGFACGYMLALMHVNFWITSDDFSSADLGLPKLDSSVGRPLNHPPRTGRILCWVVTRPKTKAKAQRIKETWGKKCDLLLFISSVEDASLPAVAMPIGEESRSKLWLKAKLTLKYIYVNHLDDADWFFKADDDTFAIVENMRRLVATYDPSKPYYLGRRLRYNDTSFLSGGAGYIMSAETLRRVVEEGLGEQACPEHLPGFIDDVILGLCLHKVGAIFPDTRDDVGRQRFIPFDVEEFYKGIGDNITYLKEYDYYPLRLGSNCCSDRPVSFHYVSEYQAQLYEYLIYRLKVTDD